MTVQGMPTEKRRLEGARYLRVWAIAQTIADEPGHSRAELADTFHLSDRQMQADLNIIRTEMRLPLVRRQGYRFVAEGAPGGAGGFDLHDAQLLVTILGRAMRDPWIPADRLRALIGKLPALFPAHLQPLVARTILAVTAPRLGQHQVFAAIATALLREGWVRLHYPPGSPHAPYLDRHPVIRPALLLPCLDAWFVIGEIGKHRPPLTRMLSLEGVTAVTLEDAPLTNGRGQ